MDGFEPFFLVGAEGSGTGLLGRLLDAHSRIALPPAGGFVLPLRRVIDDPAAPSERERFVAEFLEHAAGRAFGVAADALRAEIERSDPQSYPQLARTPWAAWRRLHAPDAVRIGERDLHAVRQLGALMQLFPAARIVHVVRDGRDVALDARRSGGARRIEDAARSWAADVAVANAAARRLPERVFEIRFETLVRQPERTLRAVCALLDQPYEPAMQANLALDPAQIGRFRGALRVAEVRAFEALAGTQLAANGYAPAARTRATLEPSLPERP